MALKTGAPERVLCVEVWLGPMDGTRHYVPYGAETIVRVGRRRADEKRGLANDLVLGQTEGVSGFHAEIHSKGDALRVKDLNSTNGTFAAGQRISGEIDVKDGETIVLSTTLLHVSWKDDPYIAVVPSEEEIASAVPFYGLLGAAAKASIQRGEGYIDTRHLAQALIESGDEAILAGLATAKLEPARAVTDLWTGGFLPERLQWLRRFVSLTEGGPSPTGKPVPSPAVRSLFSAAVTRLSGYTEAEAKSFAARALLAQLCASGGLVGTWLLEKGVRIETVPSSRRAGGRKTQRAARNLSVTGIMDEPTVRQASPAASASLTGPMPQAAAAAASGSSATFPRVSPAAAPVAPVSPVSPKSADSSDTKRAPRFTGETPPAGVERFHVPTTGDSILDQRARAIAAELEEAAALYRFSTPEDRRSVMRTLVTRALSSISPANRSRILSQIRVQFPVTAAPPPETPDETAKLKARIRELEQRLADMSAERARTGVPGMPSGPAAGGAGTGDAWRAVLQAPGGPGSPELEAVRATVAFARNLEKFLLGMVQSTMSPGDGTMSFRLPGYRYTLDSVLHAVQDGKAVGLEGLPDYLRELERWQVAILAAHHASPRIWFDRLWKKINPSVIESAQAKGGSWKLGGQATDWWNRYKELVRGLSPDVVQDQVLQTAAKTAQEEYEKLSNKPKK